MADPLTQQNQPIQGTAPAIPQNGNGQGPDSAQQILSGVPVDNDTKAAAWDAFHSATDENDLTQRLQKINLPNDAKAHLWDAKKLSGNSQAAQSSATSSEPQQTPGKVPSTWQTVKDYSGLSGAEDVAGGFLEGAAKTVQGGLNLVARGVEKYKGFPAGTLQAHGGFDDSNTGVLHKAGEAGEGVSEWLSGEELLKLATKVPALASLVRAYPKAAPILSRAVTNVAIGAAQGGVKGAANQQAAKGALAGGGAGLVGSAAGEALGTVAPKIFKKIGTGGLTAEEAAQVPPTAKFQPATNLTPQDVLTHAQDNGIDLTPGQALKTKPRQAVQGLGERAFVGGSGLDEAIQQNRQKLTQTVSDMADRFDPNNTGVSEESAGSALQEATQGAKDAAHVRASANYKKLPEDLQQSDVDLSDIQGKWQGLKENEEVALQNLPAETRAKLESVLNIGANLGTKLPDGTISPVVEFQDAIKLRSALREMGETSGMDLPARYQGMFRDLTHDVDSAMEKTADATGYTNDWRAANQGWKDYVSNYGDRQSPLYRVLNQADPARVTRDILNRGSATDILALQKAGVTLDPLKRQVISDVANAGYRVARNGLGGYTDSFLKSLFGADATKELYLNSEIGRRLGFEVNPSGTSNVLAAEMQIPTSKEGLIKGVGGSAGMAAMSKPRPAGTFLPGAPAPQYPRIRAAAGRAAGAVNALNTPPPEQLHDGEHTVFSNGQVWTLQSGQPVMISQGNQ